MIRRDRLLLKSAASVLTRALLAPAILLVATFDIASSIALADRASVTCPPDHVMKIVFKSTTLYMNWQWPDLLVDRSVEDVCSNEPIHVGTVKFEDLGPSLAEEMNNHRIRFDRIVLHRLLPTSVPNTTLFPTSPKTRITLPEGTIEDITKEILANYLKRSSSPNIAPPDTKFYRLQHNITNGAVSEPFLMSCSSIGVPASRSRICRTLYKFRDDVDIEYTFRPIDLTFPQQHQHVFADRILEPNDFLAFDLRLRQWLADMQTPPD